MYYLKGKVVDTKLDQVILESHDVGYLILSNDSFNINEDVKIFVNIFFIEENIIFVGFKEALELDVFNTLLEISGIGIKTALKILKSCNYKLLITLSLNDSFEELKDAIHINNDNYMAIAIKLKKKFKNCQFDDVNYLNKRSDLYRVLKTMGVSDVQYEKVASIDTKDLTIKEKLKQSLRILNGK